MNVGSIAVCPLGEGRFIGIECAKGRGVILPGGKWEPNETYRQTAIRELREETGLSGGHPSYIWHGPDCGGYIVFAFLFRHWTGDLLSTSKEGTPRIVTRDELSQSVFAAYYDVLFEIMEMERY